VSEEAKRRWRRGRPSILAGRLVPTGFTLFLIAFAAPVGLNDGNTEFGLLLALLAVAALAVTIAWWNAVQGAMALAVTGLGLAIFGAAVVTEDHLLVALLLGGPYLLSAMLLWFGAFRLARA
jgi:hypothetical protein